MLWKESIYLYLYLNIQIIFWYICYFYILYILIVTFEIIK